ncbi:MAG: GNAT family acetyltransferase [Desulfobacteraceae bacterium]|nr:GNAT family acetyltransferase [Desulfobacteraceae bacterium]
MCINIRVYEKKDQEEVICLWKACGIVVPWSNPVDDIERKLMVNPELFLVGVFEEKIVASVMGGYEGRRGWINFLAVTPEYQRKGFGREIMLYVESLLKEKGCPKINLQVRETNTKVIAFYNAIGYGNDNVLSLGKRIQP